MRTRFSIWLGGGLALAPLAGRAQQALPPTSPYRWYAGVGLYDGGVGDDVQQYQSLARRRDGGQLLPVQLVLGRQYRPRWALQGILVLSGYSLRKLDQSYNPISGVADVDSYTQRNRYGTLGLQVRYTLTRRPWARLQADVLAGLTLDVLRGQQQGFRTQSGRMVGRVDTTFFNYTYLNAIGLVSAGLDVRYRLAPRLEAAYDCQLATWVPVSQFFHLTNSLSLRYLFDRPRPLAERPPVGE